MIFQYCKQFQIESQNLYPRLMWAVKSKPLLWIQQLPRVVEESLAHESELWFSALYFLLKYGNFFIFSKFQACTSTDIFIIFYLCYMFLSIITKPSASHYRHCNSQRCDFSEAKSCLSSYNNVTEIILPYKKILKDVTC